MAQTGFFGGLGKIFGAKSVGGAMHSFLEKDIVVQGDITVNEGGIHIEAQVMGNIINNSGKARVVIGRSGLVQGSVTAGSVALLGRIEGNVLCKHFEIFQNASIEGDIQYQALTMHEGRIAGRLIPINNPPTSAINHQADEAEIAYKDSAQDP